MRLKKIELKGFKSFCDKTEILFNQEITGIVGPNGCGKSNIVDAIRWVMGEQSAKHLRGKSMEDVIFAGSRDREKSSMAFVQLTFDTAGAQTPVQYAGCEEISIGRRLFRDGTSEYLINKTPARLKDVTDFFLGTGVGAKAYSIIEQGRVGQIVTAKPEERRRFIEEAAGISKFQIRKAAAQRKMESTEQNLMRLTDIVAEIERQKNSLERQAKKAEKFRVIRDELKDLDLKVSAIDFDKLSTRQQKHLDQLKELDIQQTSVDAKVAEEEARYEEFRLEILENEKLVSELQEKVYEWNNIHQLSESNLQNRKDALSRVLEQHASEDRNLKELSYQSEKLANHLDTLLNKAVASELDAAELEKEVALSDESFAELQANAQNLFQAIEEAREQKNSSEHRLVEIASQRESLSSRLQEKSEQKLASSEALESVAQKHKKLDRLLSVSQEGLADVKQLKLTLTEQSDRLSDEFQSVEGQVKAEQAELDQIKEELLQKKSRLQSLEELERNFEGYLEGPRSLLQRKREGEMESILGSVADFIETEPEYVEAVSAVLGERAQTLVVDTQTDGVSAASSLRELNTGRGSFVALQWAGLQAEQSPKVREVVSANRERGVRGVVQDFVRFKPGYEKLKEVLFHDTVLVDSLSQALDIWQSERVPVATLGGELISEEGILTGGSPESTSSALLAKKREIKLLKETVNELITKVKSKEETCLDLRRKLKTLQAELETMRASCHEEEIKMTRQEQDIRHCQQELEGLDQQRQDLAMAVAELENEIVEIQDKLSGLETEEQAQSEIAQQANELLVSKRAEEEESKQKIAEHSEALTQSKVLLAQKQQEKITLDQEVERSFEEGFRLRQLIIRAEERVNLFVKQQLFLESRIAFCEKNLNRILGIKKDLDVEFTSKRDAFEVQADELREKERGLTGLHRDVTKLKDQANKETLALTEIRGHISRLNEQMLERYQVVLADTYKQSLESLENAEEFDYEYAIARVHELREQLSKAGNVNLDAIDELKEISERYDFLFAQKSDLEESLASLERAIDKINQTTKERFAETFELVNEKFKQVFPKLFRGGEAHLKLTDPDNILETGIDIAAQPPGKRLQNIGLLSGGEKALTAVSLLFSIFLIKPSPFCLLDEVDAPLDDVNVDRYNEIVKDMSQNTQFIVVTHNKRTMQITDSLYGVTMANSGVSQMVSVDLS